MRAHSFAADLFCAVITFGIVLFGFATAEIRDGAVRGLKYLWLFCLASGFVFALVGNLSILPRLFHSPEWAPTPATLLWDELLSSRGIFIVIFTLVFSFFSQMHGKLDHEGPPFSFFRRGRAN